MGALGGDLKKICNGRANFCQVYSVITRQLAGILYVRCEVQFDHAVNIHAACVGLQQHSTLSDPIHLDNGVYLCIQS